jgi:hypothetical protein
VQLSVWSPCWATELNATVADPPDWLVTCIDGKEIDRSELKVDANAP